ncbi:MaoC family dehydratase [Terasakiella sp. SH-1]|uniref:MaoC family dehydratase n=1 Tax=Terasakiella sp. SH-1 TaxID=2560057 RepID=UPI001073DB91|nr:MaoC family dehydratase [Terasakiella sp. SH-1]
MEELYGYSYDEIDVGMTDVFSKTVTEADIMAFAGVSGDTNPVHLDEAFASQTMFKTRIAHGMLSSGFISTVFGTKLPGPGCIYIEQNLKFKAPVKIGDTVVARVTALEKDDAKKMIKFETICSVGDTTVIKGEATIMVPDRS